MKFLLMVVAFYALYWLLRRSWRQLPRSFRPPPPPPTLAEPEAMLRCVECGLHLPRREAIEIPQGVFCCEAHRIAHARRAST